MGAERAPTHIVLGPPGGPLNLAPVRRGHIEHGSEGGEQTRGEDDGEEDLQKVAGRLMVPLLALFERPLRGLDSGGVRAHGPLLILSVLRDVIELHDVVAAHDSGRARRRAHALAQLDGAALVAGELARVEAGGRHEAG